MDSDHVPFFPRSIVVDNFIRILEDVHSATWGARMVVVTGTHLPPPDIRRNKGPIIPFITKTGRTD